MTQLPEHTGQTPTTSPIGYRTVIADWENGADGSPDLRPVSVTVPATNTDEALQAASDILQAHFGPSVEKLGLDDITRDWWFGLDGDSDPLLRVCAVIVGVPILDNHDDSTNELR